MKRLILAASALMLAVATPAFAAPVAYTIDPSHTQTTFSVDRFGFTTIFGTFTQAEGTIWIDEADPAASRVEASVRTASLFAGDATRDEHLKGERWLNAGKNPAITFKSTKVVPTGKDTADVTGDFTLNGVTRPVTFKVKLNRIGKAPGSGKQQAGFTIIGEVVRADFGIATAAGMIGDKVGVRIEALAIAPTAP
ncbi:MAG: polyisoprenoid-binding protein [Caulobacter sp.]|nr:polyisoprenoid-binding protein [Caulobacter sp.]